MLTHQSIAQAMFVGALVLAATTSRAQFPVFDTYGVAEEMAGNCYRLTPDDNNEVGAIWSQDLLDMTQSWDMTAEVYLGESGGGGDGMAFVLRAPGSPSMQPENPDGNNGQYMGFAEIEPSLIVEIDTDRNNQADDPDEPRDHLALMRDGDPDHDSPNCLVQPVAAIPPNVNIEDGEYHDLRVKWDADAQTITVWFNCLWRFEHTLDAIDLLESDEVIYGFTASTWEEENEHRVCNVEFIEVVPVELTDVLICDGGAVTLSVPDSYDNVTWSPAAGLNTTSGNEVEASPATTTVYTVNYDGLCDETLSADVEVAVEEAPGGVSDVAFELCNSAPVEFDAAALPPGYSAAFGPAGDPLPVTIDAPGTYDWTVTTPQGCAFAYELTVGNAEVNAVNLGDDVALCAGETVTFYGDLENPGLPVSWNGGTPGATFTVAQPGTVTVVVGDANCSVTDEVEVTLSPVFTSALQANYTLCYQDQVVLDASDPSWAGGVVDYIWYDGSDAASIAVTASGNYDVTIEAAGCTYTVQTSVMDSPITTVDLGSDEVLCEGENAQFDSGYPAAQTTWWFNGVPQPGGGPFTTSAPGLLEVVVQAGMCSATDEAEVEVVAAFDAQLPAEVAFCAGGGIQVAAQAGADSYAWSNGDIGLYGWADQAGLLTLETTVDGCVFVHQVAVDALPIPSPDLGPDGVFCAGTEVVLQSGYPNADWTNWNGEGGGSNFEVNAEGTFTVQVSVDGCIGEDEVEIDFIAVPEFDLGPDIERCPEDAVLLEAGPFMEPTSIVWNQGGNQPTHLASETGWYKATATSGDCTFSDSVYVAFDGHIEPMLSTEQHICMDAELTLDASEGIGNHLFPVSYLWETGDYHAEATIAHAGDFAVTLYNLCESVGLTISVDAIDCGCTVFVPSAFTPDNDGRNDRFIPIVGCEPSAYEFTVFNRWGEVVFRTEDVTEGWLGERQGGRNYYSAIDMYHWQLQLVWEQPGNRIPRHEYASGVVTMLR